MSLNLRGKPITERDKAYLQAFADGETCLTMAGRFGTTQQTIKNRRFQIIHKLGSDNIIHAVATAFRKGWIE